MPLIHAPQIVSPLLTEPRPLRQIDSQPAAERRILYFQSIVSKMQTRKGREFASEVFALTATKNGEVFPG
jgi:hypothetical protein